MGLFQKSVLNKYLKDANHAEMQLAYQKLVAYFHNPVIQQNIRESKEEQFQEGFLTELFVKVLGYTINPNPDYNLTTEFKNERGARKADGVILKDAVAIGVIELKSTSTKDLESIRLQAFDYKANQSKCVYVVTSNFEKLRFYIHNAVDFEEFDLFKITYEQFRLLWLCLAKTNLTGGIPLAMKEASLLKEEDITKQFYVDYSAFKHDLYNDLVANNLKLEIFNDDNEKETKLLLFKKSQKLLDRFLFVFFGEDRGLLPPNSISEIVGQWENQSDWGDDVRLYSRYKKYFGLLNTGWKGKKYEIFAYNGGLFSPDEVLDSIEIGDEVLKKHTRILTGYDFETDVDVNILGHIFENSLNEIEEITAQIEGAEIDIKKSKRKKDGVFYTPKYITKYIVENTVGTLCSEKRSALAIDENEYLKSRKGRTTKKLKELDDKLTDYRNWLLSLTICDPACGSGAFLNQTLDFLIREHRAIDELRAQLLDVPMIFTEVENSILENNIFGVDINDESVEIAKLSLWLRTAQKGRKLTSLNNNIKCGNSLIDEPETGGEKAFNWQNEFPDVFKNGGFDVVIGNPPYGATLDDYSKHHITSNYLCFQGNFDIYSAFIQLAFLICKKKGLWGFINPVSWQSGENYIALRQFLLQNGKLEIAIKLPYDVFEDAYVDTGIYVVRTINSDDYESLVYEYSVRFKQLGDLSTETRFKKLPNRYWSELDSLKIVLNPAYYELLPKVFKNTKPLNEISDSIRGILPNKNDVSETNIPGYKLYFTGGLYRYKTERDFQYVNYGDHLKEKPRDYGYFQGERILIRRLINRQFQIMANYANDEFVNKKDLYNLKVINDDFQIKYLLAIINSKLISFLKIRGATTATKDDFGQLTLADIRQIPIKLANSTTQQQFSDSVDFLIQITKQFQEIQNQFHGLLQGKFNLDKLNQKLKNWSELIFSEFLNELKKSKIKLSLSEEVEWMQYFNDKKQEARSLKSEIDKTDLFSALGHPN
jgi:type I restriction-modification system DNA methylase subunit